MNESDAWKLQAESDLQAGQRVFDKSDPKSYCQSIAKYQQCVEKNVKGIIAALDERGAVAGRPRDRGHTLDRTIRWLKTYEKSLQRKEFDLASQLSWLLSDHYLNEAKALCSLAPNFPEPGNLFEKNTEYPFNGADANEWLAPCSETVFSVQDTQRYLDVASHFDQGNARFFKALSVTKSKS